MIVRVELEAPVPMEGEGLAQMFGGGSRVRFSTEVMLNDESEEGARQAGTGARSLLDAFVNGYARAENV